MMFLKRKTPSLLQNPKLWILIGVVMIFIILARVFFMTDAVKETQQQYPTADNAVFIFFRQEIEPSDMPGILTEFGLSDCTLVGGGTHVYECKTEGNPEELIQKASADERIFDALKKESVY